MKVTRRTLLGTIAAGFAAGSAPSCVCRGRLAVAGRAAGVALRGGRGKRHLVAYPGRAVRAQPQPAVHRREQAGRGHPRRQRTGLARRAGRIHLPLCGSAVCDGRSPVRETELQPQGSAAGGDGHDGAVVPGGERAGALQDRSGNDRLRQVEARRPDLWFCRAQARSRIWPPSCCSGMPASKASSFPSAATTWPTRNCWRAVSTPR